MPPEEEKPNYYKILGLKPDATEKQIKSAHRKMAKKYHPDIVTEETKRVEYGIKFKHIQEAYEILMDARKRKLYDAGHDVDEKSIQMVNQEIVNLFNNIIIEQYTVYCEDANKCYDVFDSSPKKRSINMLKRIKNHFSEIINKKEIEVKNISLQIKFMTKIQNKITTTEEENLYIKAHENIVSDLLSIKASAELLVDNMKLGLELIENYNEEFPDLYPEDKESGNLLLTWVTDTNKPHWK